MLLWRLGKDIDTWMVDAAEGEKKPTCSFYAKQGREHIKKNGDDDLRYVFNVAYQGEKKLIRSLRCVFRK